MHEHIREAIIQGGRTPYFVSHTWARSCKCEVMFDRSWCSMGLSRCSSNAATPVSNVTWKACNAASAEKNTGRSLA